MLVGQGGDAKVVVIKVVGRCVQWDARLPAREEEGGWDLTTTKAVLCY